MSDIIKQKCDILDLESIEVNEEQIKGLQRLLDLQKSFGKRFCDFDNLTSEEKVKWTKEFMICMQVELVELLDQMSWKHWKDYKDMKPNLSEVQYEIIDVLHFYLSLCLIWGIDAKQMYKLYLSKNAQNIKRQEDPSLGYIKE